MTENGYKRSHYDWCVYTRTPKTGMMIYLLLYVDDMLIACKDKREIDVLKSELSVAFEMKDLGPSKRILGMDIFRDRSKKVLTLSQGRYLKRVLKRFNMTNCKPNQ